MFSSCKEENELLKNGYKYIAGVDEVGRGSLAGPATIAAVVFNKESLKKISKLKIKDSKQLTTKKREEIFKIIKKFAIETRVVNISQKLIDNINVNHAFSFGLLKLIDGLKTKPNFLLLDGGLKYKSLNKKKRNVKQKTIIKGDEKCFIIAAASIIAKVSRDKLMTRLAKKYPQYKFEQHKGYGTKMHIELIKKYGPSKNHRKKFLRNIIISLN